MKNIKNHKNELIWTCLSFIIFQPIKWNVHVVIEWCTKFSKFMIWAAKHSIIERIIGWLVGKTRHSWKRKFSRLKIDNRSNVAWFPFYMLIMNWFVTYDIALSILCRFSHRFSMDIVIPLVIHNFGVLTCCLK